MAQHADLPPGPSSTAVRQLVQWCRRPVPFLNECRQRYGETFTVRFAGYGTFVMMTRPSDIKDIFQGDSRSLHSGEANEFLQLSLGDHSVLVLDDEPHQQQRNLQLPAFKGERMRNFFDAVHRRTLAAASTWPAGTSFALAPSMRDITLAVILEATLGMKQGASFDQLVHSVRRMMDMSATKWALVWTKLAEYTQIHRWSFLSYNHYLRQLNSLFYAAIQQRRREIGMGVPSGRERDILDDLVAAQHNDGSAMTDEEIRDAVMTALLAGHETTATALAWAFELVLSRPEVVDRIVQEWSEVTQGQPFAAEHLPELTYLDAVIREVLRLRTVVPFVTRLLKRPMAVGDRTYPAGIQVCPCIYLVHRREDLYPYPNEFRPERFLQRRFGPHEWLPFGGGNRLCLGMQFALFEMRVVLATVLTTATLRRPPDVVTRIGRRGLLLAPSDGTRVVRVA